VLTVLFEYTGKTHVSSSYLYKQSSYLYVGACSSRSVSQLLVACLYRLYLRSFFFMSTAGTANSGSRSHGHIQNVGSSGAPPKHAVMQTPSAALQASAAAGAKGLTTMVPATSPAAL
jgi:hypothetical protein